MSDFAVQNLPDPDAFADLVGSLLDGTINPADHALVDHALATSRAHRAIYRDLAALESLIAWDRRWAEESVVVTPKPDLCEAKVRVSGVPGLPNSKFVIRNSKFALAAALLLAAAAVAIYLFALAEPRTLNPEPSSAPLASVLGVSDTATLMIDDQIAQPGEEYAGRSISLDAGEAEFMLPRRVSVRLRGATNLTVHDEMSAALVSGSASFDCPPEAKGYTVHLPGGARVIDLGTRFLVAVDSDGRGYLYVSEGKVRTVDAAGANELTVDRALLVRGGRFVADGRALVASFDSDRQPSSLEAVGPMPVEFADGVARFGGDAQSDRTYLRTVATDWTARSFTAEVTVRVTSRLPVGLPHFGLAQGDIATGYFFAPFVGPHLVAVLRADANGVHTYDGRGFTGRGTSLGLVQHPLPGGLTVPGTHRLRLRWVAEARTATFELDRDADGSIDWTVTLNGSDNGFDATNARIVLGGAGGVEFDDLIILPLGDDASEPEALPEPKDRSSPSPLDLNRSPRTTPQSHLNRTESEK